MQIIEQTEPDYMRPHGFTKCDKCPARAKYVASFINGPLYFCNAHFRVHGLAIGSQAISVSTTK